MLPVPKLPAVTVVFSLGQRHVQRPTCLDKLEGFIGSADEVQLRSLRGLAGVRTRLLAWAVEGSRSLPGRWRRRSVLVSICLRSAWAGLQNY